MRNWMLATLLLSAPLALGESSATHKYIDFGAKRVGGFHRAKHIVIKNNSEYETISIEGFSMDGDQFYFKTYMCNKPLKPSGGWCDVWLEFDPMRTGEDSATFTILYANGNVTFFHLSGEGYD